METKESINGRFTELARRIDGLFCVNTETVAPIAIDALRGVETPETIEALVWCCFQAPIFKTRWTKAIDTDGRAWLKCQYLAAQILDKFFNSIKIPRLERLWVPNSPVSECGRWQDAPVIQYHKSEVVENA